MNAQVHATAMGEPWLATKITRKELIADEVMGFELRSPEMAQLPPFSAGAHIDVRLPNGAVRQYSLCNDPGQRDRYEIGILLSASGRGGSRSAHQDLAAGDLVSIGRPRNHFPLHPARHSLLLAGGIGITPMLSMAEQLTRDGASFEMHHCARSRSRLAYQSRIAQSSYASRAYFHVDDGDSAQQFNASQVLAKPDSGTHLYVCGPQGFMDHVITNAGLLGWAEENIHFEYFAAPATPATTAAANGDEFLVQLASSGKRIPVPVDKTIAQALMEAGVPVPLSCEQGICGTCLVGVVEGQPDHRDFYLSDADKASNKQVALCCSRAHSACLVLDL